MPRDLAGIDGGWSRTARGCRDGSSRNSGPLADWLCEAEKKGPWRAPTEARDKRSEILRVLSDPGQRHGETPRLQRYTNGGGTAARGDRGGVSLAVERAG